jgi:hypothetical protein
MRTPPPLLTSRAQTQTGPSSQNRGVTPANSCTTLADGHGVQLIERSTDVDALADLARLAPVMNPSRRMQPSLLNKNNRYVTLLRIDTEAPEEDRPALRLDGTTPARVARPASLRNYTSTTSRLSAGREVQDFCESNAKPVCGISEWLTQLSQLSPLCEPCPNLRRNRWPEILTNCLVFLDRFRAEVEANQWTATELFGVHPEVGAARVDCSGALILSAGTRVVAVGNSSMRYQNGTTFYRTDLPQWIVPIWRFGQ